MDSAQANDILARIIPGSVGDPFARPFHVGNRDTVDPAFPPRATDPVAVALDCLEAARRREAEIQAERGEELALEMTRLMEYERAVAAQVAALQTSLNMTGVFMDFVA